jgi:hypothetical protein
VVSEILEMHRRFESVLENFNCTGHPNVTQIGANWLGTKLYG